MTKFRFDPSFGKALERGYPDDEVGAYYENEMIRARNTKARSARAKTAKQRPKPTLPPNPWKEAGR